ncbi:amylo-alpha-1,6-glucosidase [Dictyobacter aurantiacus]|uniref:Glycogen debranching protein n=1 Tax=Dictyobacter aurantiacus TaxID=1936993 RepID=A0A401ZHR9_9CHLR|nr:amylo-alpha-1,6-glucosidase [Dictyobacter aurantiacus]GCE06402.1 glycogen debranching protein [Dictyobacter aurantiacus]
MILKQDASLFDHSHANPWHIQVGSEICDDVQSGLDHEWLVTNGLGGYASGSLVGATTRCYHGLLVAALQPPVKRTVLVAKFDEVVTLHTGERIELGVNEYAQGTIAPEGYRALQSVSLDGDIVCFSYKLTETLTLEKRIWMEYGENTTYVQYLLHGSFDEEGEKSGDEEEPAVLKLEVVPFCLSRDYHSVTTGAEDWHFLVEDQGHRCRIRAYAEAPAYHIIANPSATFTPGGVWYWHIWHRQDQKRGLPGQEDVYMPGTFRLSLVPGMHTTMVLMAETETSCSWGYGGRRHETLVGQALMRHRRRVQQLLAVADHSGHQLPEQDPLFARLVLAADQFIVARPDYTRSSNAPQALRLSPDRKTIIAGYPWFTDWGRDSMISLPGLLLCTGRYGEARGLLKAFTSFMHNGLIPNRFPDDGQEPAYNTADATLWMFRALDHYFSTTGDWSLIKELFPKLCEVIQWHVNGTDYGIKMDETDGLLRAGAPDLQLTWMDAKVGDWVVTPRSGKPVEINALWYYALTTMESWAVRLSTDAAQYGHLRALVRQHFARRFWYEEGGYLYDVVDVEGVAGSNDPALRPNQLLAASLTRDLLSEQQVSRMLQQVTQHLLTPVGLRSLSPDDPAYQGHFAGDQRQRDSAYHQGAVWQWLLGPYVDVHLQVHNNPAALRPLLLPFAQQLRSTCLGTISELAEPEPPFSDGGCFAQAWSVAEILRCWLLVRASGS